jgi:hypothetical protein
MPNPITNLRKIHRAYGVTAVNDDDTTTRAVARFPSRRWGVVSLGLLLGHGKLARKWAYHVAATTYPPERPSAIRHAHQAGLEAMAKPPSRTAMALAVLALLVAGGLRVYSAYEHPAPKPANPASVIHRGGPWMGPLEHCHGTGVYTTHDGRCVAVTTNR